MLEKGAVVRFVRETLGCQCPDEVFERIGIGFRNKGGASQGIPDVEKIILNIGNRLLVHIISGDGIEEDMVWGFLNDGRVKRDILGLNRFRLVLVSSPPIKIGQMEISKRLDDRIHLHLITK